MTHLLTCRRCADGVNEDVVRTLLSLTAVFQVPKDSFASVPDGAFLSAQIVCRWLVDNGAEDVLLACRPLDFLCLTIASAAGTIHACASSANLCTTGRQALADMVCSMP